MNDVEANGNLSNDNRSFQTGSETNEARVSSNNAKESEAQVSSINIKTTRSCASSTTPNENEARLSPNGIALNDLVVKNDTCIDEIQPSTSATSRNDPAVVAFQKFEPNGGLVKGGHC